MALSKTYFSKILHLQVGLQSMTLRPISTSKTCPSTQEQQSQQTRPKKPMAPYMRFMSERWSKVWSELQKDVAKSWRELSEEEKKPYMDRYRAELKIWQEKKDILISYLQAMEEEDKGGGKVNQGFNGTALFLSEVQIPGAGFDFLAKASKIWNELTPGEKEIYNERARKMNEESQGNLLKSTLKLVKSYGKPKTAFTEFQSKISPQKMKAAHSEIRREWSELSDEDKEKYVKASEKEYKAYNAQMEKYKVGEKFSEDKRNMKVLMGKIKEIEEEMEKPRLLATNGYWLFTKEKKEYLQAIGDTYFAREASALWQTLDQEGKTEYSARYHKLNADWRREVAKWEARNADNPKMTELQTYKNMLRHKTFLKT